jgi:hypothetical protein
MCITTGASFLLDNFKTAVLWDALGFLQVSLPNLLTTKPEHVTTCVQSTSEQLLVHLLLVMLKFTVTVQIKRWCSFVCRNIASLPPALHSFDLDFLYLYHLLCKEIRHTRQTRAMDSKQVLLDGTELLIFLNDTKI